MARLHEEVLVVKISKLVRDEEDQDLLISDDIKNSITIMTEQLLSQDSGPILIEIVS